MQFENDIFISYAHIDDQALTEGEKGWISQLHRALEIRLGQLLGKKPRIWRDPKLDGNDYFADKLVDRLPKVASLVSVFTPRYLKSEWCRRELETFYRASEESLGVRVEDKSRVFKVVKTPIPHGEQPEEMQQLLGYEFYTVEPESGRVRELDPGIDPEAKRRYWAKLEDLAQDISALLERLEHLTSAADQAPAATAPPAPGKEPVYLAETTFDLKDERDAIKRELLDHGYQVLPDTSLPLIGPELEKVVAEQLARCRLSVHLLGHSYGIVPEGSTRSVAALQADLSLARAEAGDELDRLIWLPADREVEDERQRHFLAELETETRGRERTDLLETPLEDLKLAIHRRLRREEETPEPAEAPAGGDAPARIYLICDQRDLDSTVELEDYLFAQGLEVIVPVFDGDEAQLRQDHEESLVVCDAALVYYGAGNELWLRRKLRELLKAAGIGRSRPMLAQGVYAAPPATPQKGRLRSHEAIVMQGGESFDPAVLAPFLDRVAQKGAGGA